MKPRIFDLTREVIVISGSNGQLGAEYVKYFIESGAKVVGLDLFTGSDSHELMQKYPGNFKFIKCDITKRDDLSSALEATRNALGGPTVLINNAAIDSPPDAPIEECGPFETYPDDSWDRVMDVNVKGVYLSCKVFGGEMAKNGRGSIVNISSIYGVVSPDQTLYEYRRKTGEDFFKPAAYAVSKSALLNLTRYLAVYWAKSGVRVNTLVLAGVANNQDEAFLAGYHARIPIGRMAKPEDYNGALHFLASKASEYMTGSTLTIDGGWTAI
jgi:NAD(P)-dependent dehydrogenase (short-subunit alcohol dehydrogenase family)